MSKINRYKRFLGFHHCQANVNGKIWCFWNYLDHIEVLVNSEQHITHNMKENVADSGTFITAVYAKCTTSEKRDLWDSIHNMNNTIDGPWCIGGDFNIIMDPTEKLGGNPHRAYRSLDFISTMESCGLMDIGFTGPRYTWCNNRRPSKRIWKRLDKIMINEQWAQHFQNNTVKHLVRNGSDHRPLLLKCHNDQHQHIKYFRFLNFWTTQPVFLDMVQEIWNTNIQGNAMWRLKSKLKLLAKHLSQWSRENIGDIHEQVSSWEAKVQILEEMDMQNNNEQGREELNRGYAEYARWLGMQESLMKQKAKINWFKDGDCNTSYFHSILRDRRRRLQLHRMKNHRDRWIQGEDKIAKAAVKHFKSFFNLNQQPSVSNDMLNCIPNLTTEENNERLTIMPLEEEIKDTVFSMSIESSAGPDGFNRKFFQATWDIIKQDIIEIVRDLFKGNNLTKFYSHTCNALIPKVESPSRFEELRPISLVQLH
ncbi:PREDICTED: uncharacterized protein LOC109236955 [Nicotiana attenuata]|uniref:uncharacterized protein LOC109236955 n=1 Tax=Nicotiana attenuata TaxID=49451 RepID=UPI000904D47E|nr:PREDICTED: uncharacterized protein LOC109236955 [Nicotiana attenuata]